jgi:hypothetical protein
LLNQNEGQSQSIRRKTAAETARAVSGEALAIPRAFALKRRRLKLPGTSKEPQKPEGQRA